jgi:hypothetical protein
MEFNSNSRDLVDKLNRIGALVLTAATIYVTLQQAKPEPERANSRAKAYHGAATMYRNLAEFFGKRAIAAEAAYYREVRS